MRKPEYTNRELTPSRAVWDLTINPEIIFFQGHFPDLPILPGVVQTQWAIEFAKMAFSVEVECSQLKQIKFKEVILPNSSVTLELEYDSDKQQLSYAYLDVKGQTLSSGKIEKVFSI